MRVLDSCHGCRTFGPCWWSLTPMLRLCHECYVARHGEEPS